MGDRGSFLEHRTDKEVRDLMEDLLAERDRLDSLGYLVLRRTYESPVPEYLELPQTVPRERFSTEGIEWNDREQLALWDELASFQDEFATFPDEDSGEPHTWFRRQTMYNETDGFILYSMIRKLRPGRIIEAGSGYSTRLCLAAARQNLSQGVGPACSISCIEPYRHELVAALPVNLIPSKLERMDLSVFDSLRKGDVLFIDSTHVVKPYGDVVALFLKILPRLNPGVFVHFHDVFLPFDYPPEWNVTQRRCYTEQYLLHAYLTQNRTYAIRFATCYLTNAHRGELEKNGVAEKLRLPLHGGSFWIERM